MKKHPTTFALYKSLIPDDLKADFTGVDSVYRRYKAKKGPKPVPSSVTLGGLLDPFLDALDSKPKLITVNVSKKYLDSTKPEFRKKPYTRVVQSKREVSSLFEAFERIVGNAKDLSDPRVKTFLTIARRVPGLESIQEPDEQIEAGLSSLSAAEIEYYKSKEEQEESDLIEKFTRERARILSDKDREQSLAQSSYEFDRDVPEYIEYTSDEIDRGLAVSTSLELAPIDQDFLAYRFKRESAAPDPNRQSHGRKAAQTRKTRKAEIARKADIARQAKLSDAAKKGWRTRKTRKAEIARKADIARQAEIARQAKLSDAAKKGWRTRKLKEREINPDIKAKLRGIFGGKDHIKSGTNIGRLGVKISHSDGSYHIRREVGLFFKEPLLLEYATEKFNDWAPRQIELFTAYVIKRLGVEPNIMINHKVWAVFDDQKVQHHFDGEQREAGDFSLKTVFIDVQTFLSQGPSKNKKQKVRGPVREIKKSKKKKRREDKEQPPKVAGYSLHMATVGITSEGIAQIKQWEREAEKFKKEND